MSSFLLILVTEREPSVFESHWIPARARAAGGVRNDVELCCEFAIHHTSRLRAFRTHAASDQHPLDQPRLPRPLQGAVRAGTTRRSARLTLHRLERAPRRGLPAGCAPIPPRHTRMLPAPPHRDIPRLVRGRESGNAAPRSRRPSSRSSLPGAKTGPRKQRGDGLAVGDAARIVGVEQFVLAEQHDVEEFALIELRADMSEVAGQKNLDGL